MLYPLSYEGFRSSLPDEVANATLARLVNSSRECLVFEPFLLQCCSTSRRRRSTTRRSAVSRSAIWRRPAARRSSATTRRHRARAVARRRASSTRAARSPPRSFSAGPDALTCASNRVMKAQDRPRPFHVARPIERGFIVQSSVWHEPCTKLKSTESKVWRGAGRYWRDGHLGQVDAIRDAGPVGGWPPYGCAPRCRWRRRHESAHRTLHQRDDVHFGVVVPDGQHRRVPDRRHEYLRHPGS